MFVYKDITNRGHKNYMKKKIKEIKNHFEKKKEKKIKKIN